jgi:broad specificity phosphatase PhoE
LRNEGAGYSNLSVEYQNNAIRYFRDDILKLYVVRHGQTEWNHENRVCGRTDVQLTAKGEEQAEELSKILHLKQINIIIRSPLSRAVKTAEILSKAINKKIVIDNRLME